MPYERDRMLLLTSSFLSRPRHAALVRREMISTSRSASNLPPAPVRLLPTAYTSDATKWGGGASREKYARGDLFSGDRIDVGHFSEHRYNRLAGGRTGLPTVEPACRRTQARWHIDPGGPQARQSRVAVACGPGSAHPSRRKCHTPGGTQPATSRLTVHYSQLFFHFS